MKRSAVKKRVRQLYKDHPLEERMKINAFLDDLDSDPATKAPKINSPAIERDMYLLHDEVKQLITIARSERQRLFIRFLYSTGARVSELCGVKLTDCVVTGNVVKIRILGKGQKERFLRISVSLYQDITALFAGGKYLFETGGGKSYSPEYISNQIKRQGLRMDKRISAHIMRHSFAMEMVKKFPSKLDAVSRYLGHSSPSTTLKMYLHNQLEDSELLELEMNV